VILLLAAYFMLVSCLSYSLTLKMEAMRSSETSADVQRTTWRYILEIGILHQILFFEIVVIIGGQTLRHGEAMFRNDIPKGART
jgi:hypothetical protein